MKSRPAVRILPIVLASTSFVSPILLVGLCLLAVGAPAQGAPDGSVRSLPEPVVDPHSTEICLNSRISYHGGWSGAATEQMLGDVLHATAQAPLTGARPMIYAATSQNVYIYDADSHSLVVHRAGDWRSDHSATFEVGVAASNMVDAGAAMHLAQLESVTLWTGTANQLASCPRASATTYANSNWNPTEPIDIAISFGMKNVAGFTTNLVAISSDGSLPNPYTNGTVFMDNVLESLAYDSTFAAEDLSLNEVSQLLWASYGCSDHWVSGSKGGLVCSSAVANYYLTRRIYTVGPDAVYRFHNRRPPGGDLTTRDHRIESVTAGDVRPALRLALSRLPDAPHYLIICVGSAGDWAELEVGFAAVGAAIEAATMGLQGYVTTDLSTDERARIRQVTGIPPSDLPIALVSLGPPATGSDVRLGEGNEGGLGLAIENAVTSGRGLRIQYRLPMDAAVDLTVWDCAGREVKKLVGGEQAMGSHTVAWDCRDDQGQPVLSGVYFCRLKSGNRVRGARMVVVR